MYNLTELKDILDDKLDRYYNVDFITLDPISIPHRYKESRDVEISALMASMLAFGKRSVILEKANLLMDLLGNSPYDFIVNSQERHWIKLRDFVHRTVRGDDIIYLIQRLKIFYKEYSSLEEIFLCGLKDSDKDITNALIYFHEYIFSGSEISHRTRKHLPSPKKKSACKRINMFLRWMVRRDDRGVDFGIWSGIKSSQLVCPCDVHVINTSYNLGLINSKNVDWYSALALTEVLKKFCSTDPLLYDFALFGIGIDGEL